MANETNQPGGWEPAKPLGTGEGESPIMPQAPQVGVRTMNSDKASITTGDAAPKTYVPQTPPTASSGNQPPTPSAPSFSSQSFDLPQIDMGSSPSITPTLKKSNKGLFVALVTFIVVVGLAAIGYFVVYPLFAGPTTPTVPTTQEQTSTNGTSALTPTSTQNAPVSEPTSTSTSTATSTPTSTTPTAPTAATHVSPFKTSLDATMNSASVLLGADLGSVSLPTSKNPGLTEIVYQDASGNFIPFGDIMHAIFGADFSTGALQNAFVATSTSGFISTDTQGNRALGIVAVANSSASLAAVKSAFAQAFEANQNLKNILPTDPGAQNAWKSGQTNGTSNRYITFANASSSINYGWVGNTLVIGSSYDGFKAVLSHLQ